MRLINTRKGSAGGDTTSTISGLLLALAFAGVAAAILFSMISSGNMPQFAILMDFSGGLAG